MRIAHHHWTSAIAFPHTPLWSKSVHYPPNQRQEIQIRSLPISQRLKGTKLNHHALVLCHTAERFKVCFGENAVSYPHPADVIQNHRGFGETGTHPIQIRQIVKPHQETQGEVVRCSRCKHPLIPRIIEPSCDIAYRHTRTLAPTHTEGVDASTEIAQSSFYLDWQATHPSLPARCLYPQKCLERWR